MQERVKIIAFFLLLIFCGCSRKQVLEPREYLLWVNDPSNGLVREKQIGEYKFWVQYRPIDYQVLMEFKDEEINKSNYSKMLTDFKDMQYLLIRIGGKNNKSDALSNGIGSQAEYYDRINYFSVSVKNDLYLIDGTDTLPCLMHHFERSYGLSPYSQIMVGFKQTQNINATKTLLFDDHVLGIGRVQLSINESSLIQIPKLELP